MALTGVSVPVLNFLSTNNLTIVLLFKPKGLV